MKRFWQQAAVVPAETGWGVALDGRPVRTPDRALLEMPTAALAHAIAAEWQAVDGDLHPRLLPLTGLANAAIDRVAPAAPQFADALARYAENELLAYRASEPAALVARQAELWDPWLAWARQRYDMDFTIVAGIMHRPQPPATLARVAAAYRAHDAFRLASLQPVVTITGSAIIGLAVAAAAMDAPTAFAVGHLDELWQAEHWGSDSLAVAARASRQADLAAAVRFLTLL